MFRRTFIKVVGAILGARTASVFADLASDCPDCAFRGKTVTVYNRGIWEVTVINTVKGDLEEDGSQITAWKIYAPCQICPGSATLGMVTAQIFGSREHVERIARTFILVTNNGWPELRQADGSQINAYQ